MLKVVREHYLRDDIWSGSPLDAECDQDAVKLSASAAHYLIVDTNIVIQQVMIMSRMCAALCVGQLKKCFTLGPCSTPAKEFCTTAAVIHVSSKESRQSAHHYTIVVVLFLAEALQACHVLDHFVQ